MTNNARASQMTDNTGFGKVSDDAGVGQISGDAEIGQVSDAPGSHVTQDAPGGRVADDTPVRVLIADDQALLRASFRLLIDVTPGLVAVGEAGTGLEAIALTRSEQPDVVLMDIRMPELDGIQATRRICGDPRTARSRVLILTTFDFDEYIFAALHAGASGFLVKDVAPRELVTAVRVVAGGDALLAPAITSRLIAKFTARPEPASLPASELTDVTEREREVLTLIAGGLSNTEIANHLRLSLATVKTHIGRLLAKLHARDRAQLVIVAYETGLVVPAR